MNLFETNFSGNELSINLKLYRPIAKTNLPMTQRIAFTTHPRYIKTAFSYRNTFS